MKKNVISKIFIGSLIIILLSTFFCINYTYALGDAFSDTQKFLDAGNTIDNTINTIALKETSNYIYKILLSFAIVIAIIVAMILGIQFMVASANEKAKIKEALIPFVVGCILVFGAFTIWKIAVEIGNNAEETVQKTKITTKIEAEKN